MTYGAQYRTTMAGLMDGADDDMTLANEWQARLKMPGRERWMNEVTGARLVRGLSTPRFRDMVAWSLSAAVPTPAGMVAAARGEGLDAAIGHVLHDAGWRPDEERLTAADLDLNVLLDLGADKTAVFGLKALISWMAGDPTRAQICLAASPSLDAAGVCVAWCLRHGVLPAGRETTPMTANVPNPFAA